MEKMKETTSTASFDSSRFIFRGQIDNSINSDCHFFVSDCQILLYPVKHDCPIVEHKYDFSIELLMLWSTVYYT